MPPPLFPCHIHTILLVLLVLHLSIYIHDPISISISSPTSHVPPLPSPLSYYSLGGVQASQPYSTFAHSPPLSACLSHPISSHLETPIQYIVRNPKKSRKENPRKSPNHVPPLRGLGTCNLAYRLPSHHHRHRDLVCASVQCPPSLLSTLFHWLIGM